MGKLKSVIAGVVCSLVGTYCFSEEIKSVDTPFSITKAGSVKPCGWILDRAKAAKEGYTGNMDGVSIHFRRAWTADWKPRGKALDWPKHEKGSWSSEGGTYWFDGLIRLAWQLDDPELKELAKKRMEPLLSNMHSNAPGFLWWLDARDDAQLKEAINEGSWQTYWLLGMRVKTVAAFWDVTGDARAKQSIAWAASNRGIVEDKRSKTSASLVSGLVTAWQLTKDEKVRKCAEMAVDRLLEGSQFAKPPQPFATETLALTRKRYWPPITMPSRHGVYTCEQLLSVWKAWEMTGDDKLRDSVIAWYEFLDKHCAQPYGVTMMDEEWGWAGAKRGTETCDVAAEMYTRINILKGTASGKWGDDIELAQFNAAPACVTRDFKKHVYTQIPNRAGLPGESAKMSCSHDSQCQYRESKQWPLCCVAALNKILPNFIQAMWMKTSDGGVAATMYGPCTFETELEKGRVAFTEKTAYPFCEKIEITVDEAPGTVFPFLARMPQWCDNPSVCVNGSKTELEIKNGFARIERAWKKGDKIELSFPMKPRVKIIRDMNDYGRRVASVYLGPILMAYAYPSKDDNTILGSPTEPVIDVSSVDDAKIIRKKMPETWDWPLDSPLKIIVKDSLGRPLELVPYGCTKLRVSMFPIDER